MKDKKSFLLYCDLIHTINKLPNEKAGELFKHILSYVNDLKPVTNDALIDIAFEPIKQQLKRDLIKWEGIRGKRSEAGKKSAEIRKQNKQVLTSVESVKQTSTKPTVSVNVSDSVNVNDKEINNNKKEQLFKNSKYFDIEVLKSELDKKYHKYNISYYYEQMKNYSEQNGKKYKSWIATCRSWINKDERLNKAVYNDNQKPKMVY